MNRLCILLGFLFVTSPWGCTGPDDLTETPEPPSVTILVPLPGDDGSPPQVEVGEPQEFTAQVTDSHDPPEDLQVSWTARWVDEDSGETLSTSLGEAPADADGRTSVIGTFPTSANVVVRVEVLDTSELSRSDEVTVSVRAEYEPPTVSILTPTQGAVFTAGGAVQFVGVATSAAGPEELRVSWYSDVDGVINDSSPAVDGSMTFTTYDLSPGEHVITLSVIDDDDQLASDQVSLSVVKGDQPPTTPTVQIIPESPYAGDDLVCVASAYDPEGASVTYSYRWWKDGEDTGISLDMVEAGLAHRDETWTCEVTASDGVLSSAPGATAVTILNSIPSYASVSLEPAAATSADVLTCAGSGWVDADEDPPGYWVDWKVEGAVVASSDENSLTAASFARGDAVQCVMWPDDGLEWGTPLESAEIVIGNAPPSAPEVEISPDPPRSDDDLVCEILTPASDADGDELAYSYEWSRNGVVEGEWTSSLLPSSETELGETWSCRVWATDGITEGPDSLDLVEILPQAGDLILTEILADPVTVSDESGEYLEVYNATSEAIDLSGFTLSDLGGEEHLIASASPVTVLAGRYAVLGINSNSNTNGGIYVDYQYGGFHLDNAQDEVVLSFGGGVVDQVAYDDGDGFPLLSGQSLSLDPLYLDAVANDEGIRWCGSTSPLGGTADFGTPGEGNDDCACFYADNDGDGYGDHASCTAYDCNDSNAGVHPSASEVCEDGIDQDCASGDAACSCSATDSDGDGYGDGAACSPKDCDDGDPAIRPGASEACNGVDDDCDGSIDEGFDADSDGYTTCEGDCSDGNASVKPGATENCNGVDDDCDGNIDEGFDGDSDGYTTCEGDCNDGSSGQNPGRSDTDCDGVDDDCDGSADQDSPGDAYEPNDDYARSIATDDESVNVNGEIWPQGEWDIYSISTTDDEGWCGFFEDCFTITVELSSIPSGEDYDLFLVKGYLPSLSGKSWSQIYNDILDHDGLASTRDGSSAEDLEFVGTVDVGGDGDGGTWYIIILSNTSSDGSCSDGYLLEVSNTG